MARTSLSRLMRPTMICPPFPSSPPSSRSSAHVLSSFPSQGLYFSWCLCLQFTFLCSPQGSFCCSELSLHGTSSEKSSLNTSSKAAVQTRTSHHTFMSPCFHGPQSTHLQSDIFLQPPRAPCETGGEQGFPAFLGQVLPPSGDFLGYYAPEGLLSPVIIPSPLW